MDNAPKIALPLLYFFLLAASTAFSQEVPSPDSASIAQIPANVEKQSNFAWRLSHSVSVGFAAGGLAAIIYGIAQNNNVSDNINKGDFKKTVDAENKRNIGYAVGSSLFASGLIVFLVF